MKISLRSALPLCNLYLQNLPGDYTRRVALGTHESRRISVAFQRNCQDPDRSGNWNGPTVTRIDTRMRVPAYYSSISGVLVAGLRRVIPQLVDDNISLLLANQNYGPTCTKKSPSDHGGGPQKNSPTKPQAWWRSYLPTKTIDVQNCKQKSRERSRRQVLGEGHHPRPLQTFR